ncbi:MAG: dephospho-CoA kinase [Gammaproteobacteria bacterium]
MADPVAGGTPMRVGLTGGITCGKSLVADAFAAHGVPVIDTDFIAREVVHPGSPALARIVGEFGDGILDDAGALDRGRLRARVFDVPADRLRLEAILHPAIIEEMNRRAADVRAPYVVLVIPLLVETGYDTEVDRVLVVDCTEDAQIERLMTRDGESEAGARRILAAQVSREDRLAAADDIIDNSGSKEMARAAVALLHERYLELARLPNPSG